MYRVSINDPKLMKIKGETIKNIIVNSAFKMVEIKFESGKEITFICEDSFNNILLDESYFK
ncbi:MAG: hypothetical protein PHD20_02860 [Clostridia bacterium]|nr:hypothetical protein [Clostridia bacterium]